MAPVALVGFRTQLSPATNAVRWKRLIHNNHLSLAA